MNAGDADRLLQKVESFRRREYELVRTAAAWREAQRDLPRVLALDRELASITFQSKTVGESLKRCVEALVRHLDAALARIWTLNEREGVLELQASAGLYTHIDGKHSRIRVGDWKIGMIAQERRPHLTNAVIGDPRIPEQEWARREGLVSFAGYPLLVEDRLLGVVAIFASRPLTEITLQAMASVALRIAYATERIRADEALRKSEERFRSLADSAPVIIFQSDAAGNVTFFNTQASIFTGCTTEQLVGYGWLEAIHRDDFERIMSSHRESLERPRMGQEEVRLRRSDGQYRWMLVTSSPRYADGAFAGYLGTIVDITDLKREHGELLAAQKLESLGVLAGGIGHDFNNMLGAILAQSELVSAEVGDNSPAREGIEEIQRIGLRGSDTVRQLMAYAGQEPTEYRSIDLAELITGMLPLLKLSVSKHARLDLDFSGNLPLIRANAGQISQVIMNLVMNGSEAIGEREGIITVRGTRVAVAPQSPVMDVALPEGEYVRLEISDTGCGIPDDIRAKIFDPFFTTKFVGRGLGLAVVQGIVRGHEGAIIVVSSPKTGTVFNVYLPGADQAVLVDDAVPAASSVAVASARAGRAVLIIEDEESLRSAVCKILRKTGFWVLEAEDGTLGVQIFRARHGDIGVVLLDLTLPGLRGAEVLSELTRIQPDVKVVVTTAYSEEFAASSLGSEEVWAFIRKPYQTADLIRLLHKSLS